nr:hypothetical protein [Pseudomonadota bacterium]
MKSLGIAAAHAACLVVMAGAASGVQAAADHEQAVGAQVEQLCDVRSLATVGRFVQAANFVEPKLGQAPDAGAVVAAAACRAAPAYHGRLVAAAYRAGHQDDLMLVIAVIDSTTGQVGANFKGNLDSDAAVKLVSGSLWL